MRFASLGSGSKGNALVVEARSSRVMLDCGFSVRDATQRLARLGLSPSDLSALVVTHEHSDHAGGAYAFARRFSLPVWMTYGTWAAIRDQGADAGYGAAVNLIENQPAFGVGDLSMQPISVPHDAREPVQFVFSDGDKRLGVLTDIGCSTLHVESALSGCDALVIETNHELEMLINGDYPPPLKARIAGRYGHLDNATSAAILAALDRSRLQHVVAAHLSQKNNTPELARAALARVLGCADEWVGVATQGEGFGWRVIA